MSYTVAELKVRLHGSLEGDDSEEELMVRGVVSFGGERDQASSQGSFFLTAAFGKADTFA